MVMRKYNHSVSSFIPFLPINASLRALKGVTDYISAIAEEFEREMAPVDFRC